MVDGDVTVAKTGQLLINVSFMNVLSEYKAKSGLSGAVCKWNAQAHLFGDDCIHEYIRVALIT